MHGSGFHAFRWACPHPRLNVQLLPSHLKHLCRSRCRQFFGAIICTVQSFCFERDAIISLYYANELCSTFWLLLFAFVFFSTLSYALTARFFQVSEAALFHLSMQTEGLWSVGFSVWADHIMPGPLFFVSLMAAVAGVCVYEMAPSPVQEDREEKKKMAE